ncbi:MAG: polymorphic toxin type 50 domain-containing protein [Clostridia bacterium]
MEDIASALLEAIRSSFKTLLGDAEVTKKTYMGAAEYAERVGAALSEAFGSNLSSEALPDGRMYWNIADRTVRPMLEQGHNLVAEATVQVQQTMNKAAGIGLKAQAAPMNTERVDSILNKLSSAEQYDDAAWILDEPVKTFVRCTVDDTLRKNVDFQGKAGLSPRIIRTAESHCCEWCSKLEGTYRYPDVPDDIYRRHNRCRCAVEYDPGGGMRQDVWSKRWTTPEERDKIEARKALRRDHAEKTIQTRINKGEYSLEQSHQQYLKHVFGTPQYQQYEATRIAKGSTAQGRLTINEAEAQQLVLKYSGKGVPVITSGGSISNKEFVSADHAIGQCCTADGQWLDTKRFEIHHGKKSSHIVPVKEIKT